MSSTEVSSLPWPDLDAAVDAVMSRVDDVIAPTDSMYAGSAAHYLSVARDAAGLILQAVQRSARRPQRILDFGCGYGRVLRVLRAAFTDAEIIACDLDASAVQHCAVAFGATALAASPDLAETEQVRDIDLLWCGSVLTHLDAPQWGSLLRYVARALSPGGVAVLTTHGRRMAWRLEHIKDYGLTTDARSVVLAAYRASGFGYSDYPAQSGYGISVSSPGWVLDRVLDVPTLRVTGFVEAGWDSHQDVVTLTADAVDVLKANR